MYSPHQEGKLEEQLHEIQYLPLNMLPRIPCHVFP